MKMQKLVRTTGNFYSVGKGFRVMILKDSEGFSAYLNHKDYGVWDLMFGMDKDPSGKPVEEELFVAMVECNASEYIHIYQLKYM